MKFSHAFVLGLSLLFLSTSSALAEIEFITSDTTSQVSTVAGFDRNSGIQQIVGNGLLENNSFAEVKEVNAQGGGSATASIDIDTTIPEEAFAQMQVTASTLPADGDAFSEAKVQYFFEKPSTVFIEKRIVQGDTRFFLDGVEEVLPKTVSEFKVLQGLHSFEIEVVTGTEVINPNFAIIFLAREDESEDGGTPNTPEVPVSFDADVNAISVLINNIRPRLTAANKAAQKANRLALKALLTQLQVNIDTFLVSADSLDALTKARKGMSRALGALRRAGSDKNARKAAKQALRRALNTFTETAANI